MDLKQVGPLLIFTLISNYEFQVQAVVDLLYSYAVNCDNLTVLENEVSELVGLAVNMHMEGYQYSLLASSIVEALR